MALFWRCTLAEPGRCVSRVEALARLFGLREAVEHSNGCCNTVDHFLRLLYTVVTASRVVSLLFRPAVIALKSPAVNCPARLIKFTRVSLLLPWLPASS